MAVVVTACFGTTAFGQTTWFVSNDPAENPDFAHPRDALASPMVVDGDTIEVSEGLAPYSVGPDDRFDFLGKAVTMRAEGGERPVLTSISSPLNPTSMVRFTSGEGPDSVLEGFVLRPNAYAYAGVYIEGSSPTIRRCEFSGLTTAAGPLVFVYSGSATVEQCEFRGNNPYEWELIDARTLVKLQDCVFVDNSGIRGLLRAGSVYLLDCRVENNRCPEVGSFISGMWLTVERCTFEGNSAFNQSAAEFLDVGAMFQLGNTVLARNGFRTFIRLQPWAIVFVRNTTMVQNGGEWLHESPVGATTLQNCIIWNNGPQPGFGAGTLVGYSNVQGGWPGVGNIDRDPMFADAQFRLGAGSPCIDAGDNTAVPTGVTKDLFRSPRFRDDPATPDTGNGTAPIVDMGAAEFFVCRADILPDGIVNNEDFFYFLTLFCAAHPGADFTTFAVPGTQGYGVPNGAVTNDDFFFYLTIFVAGCD
ncbi:MAG: right-handed parallel beta-helix repeat-containing protein [Phycisphaeraceae bacterium]|nr:right-handed parallel beta-helix repeat-containing protein [Phycisphaeraceae bacterium]